MRESVQSLKNERSSSNLRYRPLQNEQSNSKARLQQESSIKRRSLSFSRSKSRTRPGVGEGPSFFDSVRHSTSSFLRSASKTRIDHSATKKHK